MSTDGLGHKLSHEMSGCGVPGVGRVRRVRSWTDIELIVGV